VTDAQGRTVQVRLDKLEATSGLRPGLFVLKDPAEERRSAASVDGFATGKR